MERALLSAVEALYDCFEDTEPDKRHPAHIHIDATSWADFDMVMDWALAEHAIRFTRAINQGTPSAFLSVDLTLVGERYQLRVGIYSPRFDDVGQRPAAEPIPDRYKELRANAK